MRWRRKNKLALKTHYFALSLMEFLNFSDQKKGHVHQIIHNVNRILIPKADKIKFQPYLPERVLYILLKYLSSTSFSLAKIETSDTVPSSVLKHKSFLTSFPSPFSQFLIFFPSHKFNFLSFCYCLLF